MGGGANEIPRGTSIGGPSSSTTRKDFTVLVTGTGPFPDAQGGRYGENDNTSHLVTKMLPSLLTSSSKFNPTGLPIRILTPTSPPGKYLKTEYAYIRWFIQNLYDEYRDTLDAIVHLGMADGWEWYSVEERAFNENFTSTFWGPREASEGYYLIPDDVGKTIRDISDKEGKQIWKDMPTGLSATFNVERLVNEARRVVNSQDNDVEKMKVAIVPHFDAGSYCCGFIFYESLATCLRRRHKTKVAFCHIPGWRDHERLERGADVVCAVIGGLCKQVSEPGSKIRGVF